MYTESTLHVLRDCERVSNQWLRLVKHSHWEKFFSLDLPSWIKFNLSENLSNDQNSDWSALFGVASNFFWQWRNADVFNTNENFQGDIIMKIKARLAKITAAHNFESNVKSGPVKQEVKYLLIY